MTDVNRDTPSASPTTGQGTLGLAWAKGYLDLMVSGVSVEQLLRHSHDEIGVLHPISFIQLFSFDHEGRLAPTMLFGTPYDGHGSLKLAKDELHPITDCARTEDSLAIASAAEFSARYPGVSWGNGPGFFVPLRVGPLVDGVFAIVFKKEHAIDWSAHLEFQDAIHIIAQLSNMINTRSTAPRELTHSNDPASTLGLSDRQMVIAKMIAQGLTNKTIARELGFSEATIRYETIKLYERLRVKNRSHAAARIHQLGIS